MFEKFSNLDIDSAGRGGEYVVQVGTIVFNILRLLNGLNRLALVGRTVSPYGLLATTARC